MKAIERMARAWWDIRESTMPERVRQKWEDGSALSRELLMSQCAHALAAIRSPDHDMTANVVEPTQDRAEAVRIWTGIIDGVLAGRA